MRAEIEGIGDTYSIEFWFRNSLPNNSRPVTAYLFSRGIDGMKEAEGDNLGIGGTYASAGRLLVYQGNQSKGLLAGLVKVEPKSWHHVAMVREGERIRVYLNGNPKPDIAPSTKLTNPPDVSTPGTYKLIYASNDFRGFEGSATRTVKVVATPPTITLNAA